jgi:hypothetical protein
MMRSLLRNLLFFIWLFVLTTKTNAYMETTMVFKFVHVSHENLLGHTLSLRHTKLLTDGFSYRTIVKINRRAWLNKPTVETGGLLTQPPVKIYFHLRFVKKIDSENSIFTADSKITAIYTTGRYHGNPKTPNCMCSYSVYTHFKSLVNIGCHTVGLFNTPTCFGKRQGRAV